MELHQRSDKLRDSWLNGAKAAMEYRRDSQGLHTFVEHCGPFSPLIVIGVGGHLFLSLLQANQGVWLGACVLGMALQVSGAMLIGYAKLPTYRAGQFLTFGLKSVTAARARKYRWGWRVFFIGVAASALLLTARQLP
jgi:hypothetical protein